MTDEQAVRGLLQRISTDIPTSRFHDASLEILALLDAKDAALADYAKSFRAATWEASKALSRAEQAEAALAERDRIAMDLQALCDKQAVALAEQHKAHQAFREEVSEACHNARYYAGDGEFLNIPEVKRILERFILPAKPADKLAKILSDTFEFDNDPAIADRLRAAIERAGGTISFEGEG